MAHFNLRGRKSDVYHALTIVSESEILNDLLYDPKPVQKRRVLEVTVLIERGGHRTKVLGDYWMDTVFVRLAD